MNKKYNSLKIRKPEIKFVLIALCTYKRPKMLKNALESIENIIYPQDIKTEILVIDNDVNKSALNVVQNFEKKTKFKIHYKIEEKRGLSFARNKVLKEAISLEASHLLFFDDDERLNSNCLNSHINYYQNTPNAFIISGPTQNCFSDKCPNFIKKNIIFKQNTSRKTGDIRKNCATGNVFFPVNIVTDHGLMFSEEYIFMGGEDGDFFTKASNLGFTIVWNNDGIIYEDVPTARTKLNYLLKKSYYNGYSGAFSRIKQKKKQKKLYFIKNFFILILNCLLILPSFFTGMTNLLNIIGICARTVGKLDGIRKNKPYDFYKNIYGE